MLITKVIILHACLDRFFAKNDGSAGITRLFSKCTGVDITFIGVIVQSPKNPFTNIKHYLSNYMYF